MTFFSSLSSSSSSLLDARAVTRPPRPRVVVAVAVAVDALPVAVVDARRSNPDRFAKAAATMRRRR
jgi:hypothetical protein